MNSHKSIFKILIVVFCLFIGGIVTQMDASAYFNPKVKKSSNGNWMQCYALQYEKKTGGGTFLGGAQIGHVASTDRLCAYVNSEGKMITGNVSLASNPSGTASLKEDLKGKGNPKVYFDVKNKKKIDFYQCNDGSLGSECYSELAKSWNTKKGDDFEKLAKEINDFANEKYGDYTKMVLSNNSNSGSLTQDLSTEAGSNENNDEDGSSEIIEDCANQGGAQSLGWIICPIMSLLGDAAEGLYNSAVEPALNIEPKLFSDSDTNTAGAWGLFRNIANIIFVILMLLVIFSQLTGVGIDNYGIKKILPKLIVVAVLTNLSYVLCVLAIDVSNILGNSFQGLFEGMREGLNLTLDFKDGTVIGNQIKSTVGSMVGVGVLSALVGMSGGIWEAPMVALSLLLGAIGVVISIFFLFVLLAAREAAIVVLVVLAPVAMVLYALPNTKKFFDKWLKAFEGLLLVYPIAGLLVGGGNYVSALLIHSGMGSDFFGALTAMIAGVLPIFFIPTMLKGSFSALGTIGARISGFGAGASKRVTGAVRNTEGFKGLQDRAGRFATRRKYETGRNAGAVSRFLRGGQYGMNRTRNQYFKDELDAIDQNMFGDDETFQQRLTSARSAAMSKGYAERVGGLDRAALIAEANSAGNWIGEAGGSERMSELIKTMESRGMENEIFGLLRRVDVSTNSGVMQTLANSNNKILKAYGKTGNGVGYNDFMAGTTSVSMQRYAEQKGGEFVDGLDDKTLAEINRADRANGTSIMSTGQLTQAAANLNDEASIEQVNSMLAGRNDIDGVISGEQLTKFNNSTLLDLEKRSHNDPAVKNAIIRASNAVMADPKLVASMNHENKTLINNIRSSRNLPPIP